MSVFCVVLVGLFGLGDGAVDGHHHGVIPLVGLQGQLLQGLELLLLVVAQTDQTHRREKERKRGRERQRERVMWCVSVTCSFLTSRWKTASGVAVESIHEALMDTTQ